jgi:hypothetical protein
MEDHCYPDPVAGLIELGRPDVGKPWMDYAAKGIGREHIPALIRMMLDERLMASDAHSSALWAGVHAWRALGELEAAEAAKPLVGLLDWIDEREDDWVLAEVPVVFGKIGRSAIPVLEVYLADRARPLFGRIAAAHALAEIGLGKPRARDECVAVLSAALERFAEADPALNAFLVSYLLDLEAVETADLIKRAYDAERIDVQVVGEWEDARVELGLGKRSEKFRSLLNLEGFPALQARAHEMARRRLQETGRNEPCWCGSRQKYKHCHMRLDEKRVRE